MNILWSRSSPIYAKRAIFIFYLNKKLDGLFPLLSFFFKEKLDCSFGQKIYENIFRPNEIRRNDTEYDDGSFATGYGALAFTERLAIWCPMIQGLSARGCERYIEIVQLLVSGILRKMQFRFDQDSELDVLDNDSLDDDVSVWNQITEFKL